MNQIENVIIVGSGKSATDIRNWEINPETTKVVVVNNAWNVTSKWDFFIVSPDYKKEIPAVDFLNPKQMYSRDGRVVFNPKTEKMTVIPDKGYAAALFPFGGHEDCGFSIVLNAAYWSLVYLRPKNIGFIGCDMNYTPSEDGSTAFYGVGDDIKENGIPDPDRMIKVHHNDDPDALEKLYTRFAKICEHNDISVVNYSKDPDTRLPYLQVEFN